MYVSSLAKVSEANNNASATAAQVVTNLVVFRFFLFFFVIFGLLLYILAGSFACFACKDYMDISCTVKEGATATTHNIQKRKVSRVWDFAYHPRCKNEASQRGRLHAHIRAHLNMNHATSSIKSNRSEQNCTGMSTVRLTRSIT